MKREPFEIECDGIELRGELFVPGGPGPFTAVPLCHGIPRAGKRPGDAGYLPLAQRLADAGYGALVFNLRGCGVSDGDFDIMGWGRDVVAVTETLHKRPDVKRVVPWGFSGGAAAGVWAAAHNDKIDAVALFACPAEFGELSALPQGGGVADYFREVGIIRDPNFPPDTGEWLKTFARIKPENFIREISPRPVLILHGSDDETVSVDHAARMKNAAGENAELRIIDGGLHRLRESEQAIEAAFRWLESIDGK